MGETELVGEHPGVLRSLNVSGCDRYRVATASSPKNRKVDAGHLSSKRSVRTCPFRTSDRSFPDRSSIDTDRRSTILPMMCALFPQFLRVVLASVVMITTALGVDRADGQFPDGSASEVEELKTVGEADDHNDLDGVIKDSRFRFRSAEVPACQDIAYDRLPRLFGQCWTIRGPPRGTLAAA